MEINDYLKVIKTDDKRIESSCEKKYINVCVNIVVSMLEDEDFY